VATATWRLMVVRWKYTRRPKTIFSNQTTRKTQNDWRDLVRPSRCNAFAIARFLVSSVSWNVSFNDTVRHQNVILPMTNKL